MKGFIMNCSSIYRKTGVIILSVLIALSVSIVQLKTVSAASTPTFVQKNQLEVRRGDGEC